MPTPTLGAAGEALVAERYQRAGFEILERNWRSGRDGEIDLVMRRGGVVVFCEVKTRASSAFGAPVEAVGYRKQAQLRRLGAAWLAHHRAHPRGVRFDVASVVWPRGSPPSVEIYEAAF